jgi:hypothetical protein
VWGAAKGSLVPRPQNDKKSARQQRKQRSRSYVRRKRVDETTRRIRLPRDSAGDDSPIASVNPAPRLPEPSLNRLPPPPAPLPVDHLERLDPQAEADAEAAEKQRKQRVDRWAILALGAMVVAMLITLALHMLADR